MKRWFVVILLIKITTVGFSQERVQADSLLNTIAVLVDQNREDEALLNFKKSSELNLSKTEDFYFSTIKDKLLYSYDFALTLADIYQEHYLFHKAYKIYASLLKNNPQNVSLLSASAKMLFRLGKVEEALSHYEIVLTIDSKNIDANIYIGNYYFYMGKKAWQENLKHYTSIKKPTKMDEYHYREKNRVIYLTIFKQAQVFFERVLIQFPSVVIKKNLQEIELKREQVGI